MASSGTGKNRRAEQAAELTGDLVAHTTKSGAPESGGRADPLLSLLRPPEAAGELGRLRGYAVTRLLG